jgi:hypothetical protein
MTFEELEALSAEKFNLNTSTSQPIPSSQDKRREFEKVQAV